jgi:hypothetical protein
MRIPKRRSVPVIFEGHDGKLYDGETHGVRNGIAIVRYTVPGLGMTTAYLDRSAWGRVHRRRGRKSGAIIQR